MEIFEKKKLENCGKLWKKVENLKKKVENLMKKR